MDGIIIVNKPKGCTSNFVVNKVKKILDVKVGHTGTLDPNATGVLPLLLGKGTKFSKYLINHDKKYIATLKLGEKTSTGDVEGEIIETKDVDLNIFDESYIKNCFDNFIGDIVQKPPIYSAIKINGKKLYEYARNNINVDIPERSVKIYSLNLVNFDVDNKIIVFDVECSKGTYIRTLCEDIAENLGTVGFMLDLCRVRAGDFDISDSVSIEDIENNSENVEWINNHIISIENLLENCDNFIIDDKIKFDKFLNGVKLSCDKKDGVYKIYFDGNFIGSGVCENNFIKRDIILI